MQADLASLVGSRICHDLISPIGAIGNGVELLGLAGGGGAGEEMALIQQSVETAAAKIRFFRIAYGAASVAQKVGAAEVRSILAPLSEAGRLRFDWQIDAELPRMTVRCIFLMIQAMESALPLGGTLTISESGATITMIAEGRRIAMDEGLWAMLTDPGAEAQTTAAQIQFALLPPLLAEMRRTPEVMPEAERLTVRF